jgi:hypothetical protein
LWSLLLCFLERRVAGEDGSAGWTNPTEPIGGRESTVFWSSWGGFANWIGWSIHSEDWVAGYHHPCIHGAISVWSGLVFGPLQEEQLSPCIDTPGTGNGLSNHTQLTVCRWPVFAGWIWTIFISVPRIIVTLEEKHCNCCGET